jgi:hypothetical protein
MFNSSGSSEVSEEENEVIEQGLEYIGDVFLQAIETVGMAVMQGLNEFWRNTTTTFEAKVEAKPLDIREIAVYAGDIRDIIKKEQTRIHQEYLDCLERIRKEGERRLSEYLARGGADPWVIFEGESFIQMIDVHRNKVCALQHIFSAECLEDSGKTNNGKAKEVKEIVGKYYERYKKFGMRISEKIQGLMERLKDKSRAEQADIDNIKYLDDSESDYKKLMQDALPHALEVLSREEYLAFKKITEDYEIKYAVLTARLKDKYNLANKFAEPQGWQIKCSKKYQKLQVEYRKEFTNKINSLRKEHTQREFFQDLFSLFG